MTSRTKAPQPHVPARIRRFGLYGPFVAVAIALLVWGAAWLWMKGRIERDLDAASASVKSAGGAFTWSERRISGYPFRFDVDFSGFTWRGPDGWGVSAPELRSETSAFAFGHWVAYAPGIVTLVRPVGGAVRIAAQVLRASVSDTGNSPPTFSLEGQDLTFTPMLGAKPFLLASAGQLHIHTRAGPADQGAFLIEVDEAKASPASELAAVAEGGAVNLEAEAIYDHAAAMAGLGWTAAMRSWAIAGGKAQVRRLHFQAGPVQIDGRGSDLALNPDGRLVGELGVTHGAASLAGLRATKSDNAVMTALTRQAGQAAGDASVLSFQAGRMFLGTVPLGRSPKVY